jgi:signal transduction histidine kinase
VGTVLLLESARGRLRRVDPFKLDIAIAALFVAVSIVELVSLDAHGHNRPVTIAAGVVSVSALAFRRRNAVFAAALFTGPMVLQALLDGFLTKDSTIPFVGALFLLYSIGRYADARGLRASLLVLIPVMVASLGIEEGGVTPEDFLWATFMFLLPVLAGRALRNRTLLQAELRKKAEQAERNRADRAQAAVEDERVRIATELQQLVANGLTAMVVQAGAVPRAVAAGDSGRAGAALAAVETTGREALTEMRALLGVLRREDDVAKLAPQPGLGRLEALAQRTRERGLDVRLDLHGWRRDLPAGVDLTAYRVLEDALDAAREHAARSAEVYVRYRPRELQLQVTDDRGTGGAGDRNGSRPFTGLRDRVALYGGRLRTATLDGGAFRLRATLPLEDEG